MPCTVLFVGGPKDGEVIALPPEEPPPFCELLSGPTRLDEDQDPDRPVSTVMFTYERRVNPMDDGPLWIYVPQDPNWTAPLGKTDMWPWKKTQQDPWKEWEDR